MDDCLFCKIINKDVPSFIVYEDDDVIAFLDISPVNPGHTLVLPKAHSYSFEDAEPITIQKLALAVQVIAKAVVKATGVTGYNLEVNNGAVAGQIIPHLHVHIVPRHETDGLKHWPGTPYPEGMVADVQANIRNALHAMVTS